MMRSRRELLAERYNMKANSKKWKHVLDISQDAVTIYDSTCVLYRNKALDAILSSYNCTSESVSANVLLWLVF